MFTGLIESIGEVVSFSPQDTGACIGVRAASIVKDACEGDSICVNGVCLTAVSIRKKSFSADLAPETLARTNLSTLKPGDLVNLERALLPTTRLGGHLLQGHVDGVGTIVAFKDLGEGNWWLTIALPAELERYLVFKGSIAIDGISLTVAEVKGNEVGVTIVPHTWLHTNLQQRQVGDLVNLETDVIAKYVEKMLSHISLPK